jgi:hypothetical protein
VKQDTEPIFSSGRVPPFESLMKTAPGTDSMTVVEYTQSPSNLILKGSSYAETNFRRKPADCVMRALPADFRSCGVQTIVFDGREDEYV